MTSASVPRGAALASSTDFSINAKTSSSIVSNKATSRRFFEVGLLQFRKNQKEVWFSTTTNKKKMLNVPFGDDPYMTVVSYFQSDEGIDALKFLVFSHESQVNNKKLFGDRKDAEFIDGTLKEIKDNYFRTAKTVNLSPESLGKWLDEKVKKNNMKTGIAVLVSTLQLFDKYTNINYSHYKFSNRTIRRAGSERIEIRYFGGEGYEDKIMTFRRVLGELLYALDVATDPEKEKDRYYKKVYKILNSIKEFDKEKSKRK